jgi:hypothetical protein
MTLLIIRPEPEAQKTADALMKRGLKAHIMPVSKLKTYDIPFDDAGYDAVIFTSKRGIRATTKPVFQLETTGEELAHKINVSPYKKFLWGAGVDRAVDLRALCPLKHIDLVILYEMTPLNPVILHDNLTGVLHFSLKHAELLFKCEGAEKVQDLPHFCLSKRIEQALPKDVIKMSAEKPTEEALITLVEEEIKPVEMPPEKQKSVILPVLLSGLLGAGLASCGFYFMPKPKVDLAPLMERVTALESTPTPVTPPAFDPAPLSREITLLKERARVEAQPIDLTPLEKRLTALEQNQAVVVKLVEKHKRDLDLQAQITKVNAPTAAVLQKSLATLKPAAADEGMMTHVKSFIKITKSGDAGLKNLDLALQKNDLAAALTAWNAQAAEFRAANPSFEQQLSAAIAGEKTVNSLKSQMARD